MNSHFCRIHSLSFPILIILILVPTSSGSNNEQYTICSQSFECANVQNLSYPFWGGNRPEYCGHPNFKLNCRSQAPQITINSIPYRVLSIDNPTTTLTVARAEFWNNPCPNPTQLPINATLDLDAAYFTYCNDSQNLIILYGCQELPVVTLPNQFSCSTNGTTTSSYFIIPSGGGVVSNDFGTLIPGGCNSSVVVRVNQTVAQGLVSASPSITIEQVLDSGFGLRWDANDTICRGCALSGGVCGSDLDSEFACLSSDKAYPVACNSTRGGSGVVKLEIHTHKRREESMGQVL